MTDDAWQIFDVHKLITGLQSEGPEYREFLRAPSLSCGIYHLPRGARDMQSPHDEDEVYFVLAGKARMRVTGEEREAIQGVRAELRHGADLIGADLGGVLRRLGVTAPAAPGGSDLLVEIHGFRGQELGSTENRRDYRGPCPSSTLITVPVTNSDDGDTRYSSVLSS